MAKIDRVQEVSVDLLKPYENNAKIHSEEQVQKIADSIQEFGFISPCLIDKENRIIAGHGRVMAAKILGMKKVPCVYVEGLTDAQRRAYILADNRLTELGDWDQQLVSDELERLKDEGFDIDLTGFDVDDIFFEDIEDILPEPDPEELNNAEPRVHRGEVWRLGDHRLMCGDSTKAEDVKILAGGVYSDLCITDPPYNVSLGTDKGHPLRPSEAKARHLRKDGLTIANDSWEDEEAFSDFLLAAFINMNNALKPGGVFYIWFASSSMPAFWNALTKAGLTIRQQLVWVKNLFTVGRQDYQWRHEPCLYGWTDGAPHYFIDMRTLSTVQEYDSLKDREKEELIQMVMEMLEEQGTVMHEAKPVRSELHPTMKPVNLIKKQIRNSSREGEVVLDLFGGSGTTLIACEEMNRRCLMMEYDPHYADVIIHRWEEMTGKKAERL